MTSRVGVVSYTYDADGNFATGSGGRSMAWNALNQMTRVAAGTTQTTFDYAPNGARFRRVDNGATTTYTIGNVEIVKVPGSTEYRRYLGGVAIDYLRSVGGNETRYVFSDHLGSPSVFANPSGAQLEAQSFNALGNRRDASNWQTLIGPMASTTHGFTGHEHVDALNVIHMNGRVYDPQIGRMLQPDPLADGTNQGLNRYTYVVNNPLSLTDPTGYSWFSDVLRVAVGVVIVMYAPYLLEPYLGAFGGVVAAGFIAGAVTTGSLQGGLYGAFAAGLFYGIDSGFQQAGWAQDLSTAGVMGSGLNGIGFSARVLASGVAGGVVSDLQGGKFGNGFISAGVTAGVMPKVGGLPYASERMVASAMIGGTISVVAGGKFANGAETAAFQAAFSELARSGSDSRPAPDSRYLAESLEVGPYTLADNVVLFDSTVDGPFWHTAEIIGSDARGWAYYSKDDASTNTIRSYSSLADFEASDTSKRYDLQYRISQSSATDLSELQYANSHWNEGYSWYQNNCADLVSYTLRAGDFNMRGSTMAGISVPHSIYNVLQNQNYGTDVSPQH